MSAQPELFPLTGQIGRRVLMHLGIEPDTAPLSNEYLHAVRRSGVQIFVQPFVLACNRSLSRANAERKSRKMFHIL